MLTIYRPPTPAETPATNPHTVLITPDRPGLPLCGGDINLGGDHRENLRFISGLLGVRAIMDPDATQPERRNGFVVATPENPLSEPIREAARAIGSTLVPFTPDKIHWVAEPGSTSIVYAHFAHPDVAAEFAEQGQQSGLAVATYSPPEVP